jgi:hypothetical protein
MARDELPEKMVLTVCMRFRQQKSTSVATIHYADLMMSPRLQLRPSTKEARNTEAIRLDLGMSWWWSWNVV